MCLFGQGFDEYMNLVLDEAEEVHMKSKNRKTLGELWASPNNIREGEKCPSVRPSTKSFFDLNEICYIGRGR